MPYGKGFVETDDVDWWFLRSSSSSCVSFRVSPAVPVFICLSFSSSPFGPMGSLWGGAVVVRGHPGDIPGFPVEIGILGYNGCCVLVAGKLCPQQSLFSFLFFLVLLSSNNKLMHLLLRVD